MMNAKKKTSTPIDLTNPQAERIVIGKLIQSAEVFWSYADSLQSMHFSVAIHERIYSALRDIHYSGRHPSLTLIQATVGPEYGEGYSTMTLVTALMRDVADIEDIGSEVRKIMALWRRRRMIELFQYGMEEARKAETDEEWLMLDMENALKDVSSNSQGEPLQTMAEITRRVLATSRKTQDTGRAPGFDTGLTSLDEILGRIHPGDFGFICARQGDAKTVLALQIANYAQFYAPSVVFELEMRKEDLGRRALAGQSNVSVSQIEEGDYQLFEAEELKAAQMAFENSKCYIDDRPKLRIDQIRQRCMTMKRSKGLGVVVIDHLRLVGANGRYSNKFDRIEYVTGEMKSMAKELDIAVIALSQVTRTSQRRDDPFPQLTDSDGGASIEQDADWALGMFRRDRWLLQSKPRDNDSPEHKEWAEEYHAAKDLIEIKTLKRRRGSDGQMRQFKFDGRRGLILERER